MKIILMGTSSWVIPMFDRIANEHDVVAVFTKAPAPTGRKKILTASPVHTWADSRGLTVYTDIKEFDSAPSADFIIVASFGVILRDNVLNAAPCINIHPSDLPKYRGPSPMRTAVYNGDRHSAVCIMKITNDVDAGDVYMRTAFEIGEDDTNTDIEKIVGEISADMMSTYLKNPDAYPAQPQTGIPTYTRKFTSHDEFIDWSRTAQQIHNQIRALDSGRTKINGADVKILETKIADGKLEILKLQPAGKNPMDWKSFVNGLRGADVVLGK